MKNAMILCLVFFSVTCFAQSSQAVDGSNLYDGNISSVGYMTERTRDKLYSEYYGDTIKPTNGTVLKKFDSLKTKQTKVDSMDIKVISMRELANYLERINLSAQRQFNLTEVQKYEAILKTIQAIYADADRKRRK